jgi:hypothetical protein
MSGAEARRGGAEGDARALADAALAYAARGWPVLPLAPRTKIPAIAKRDGGRGVYDATTDPELIRAWWDRWPEANVGIAAGAAFWCLDVDYGGWDATKPDGADAFALLTGRYGPLPATVQQLTGGGGWQFLFRANERIGNGVGFLPGLDTRSAGGYITAPPSVHPDTAKPYQWRRGHEPGALELAPAPAWLLALIKPPPPPPRPTAASGRSGDRRRIHAADSYGQAALAGEVQAVATAGEGTRNNALFMAAARLGELAAAGKLEKSSIRAALAAAGESCGLARIEIQRTIESGLRRGLANPRGGARS